MSMGEISPVRHVGPLDSKKIEPELKIQYYIWDGCVEAKWIEVEGIFLVNPKFVKLFKQRHKQNF